MGEFAKLQCNAVLIIMSRIRNYMSKPWFLNIAMNGESSPLSDLIASVLQGAPGPLPAKYPISPPIDGASAAKPHPK
jgi:hypothetical protein